MIRINLFKPEKKDAVPTVSELPAKEPKPERPSSTPPLILLLAVVGIAALAFTQKNAINRERGLLEAANMEKRKLQNVLQKLQLLEFQKSVIEKKIQLISALKDQQDVAVKIMDALSGNLPDWVWLSEVNFENMVLRIKGRSTSNTLIADYIAGLENSAILDNVSLVDITQKSLRGQSFLEFSLTAAVAGPPPLAPPAPAGKPGAKTPQKGKRP